MPAPNLGSLLIGSDQADVMKAWYAAAFAPEVNEMGAFVFGNVQVYIEPHTKVSGKNKDGHRILINLDVDDARAHEAHLKKQNVQWIRPVEQESFGLIGTVADPDGNVVQIIQWGATPTEGHN